MVILYILVITLVNKNSSWQSPVSLLANCLLSYLVRSFSPIRMSGFLRGGKSFWSFLTWISWESPSSDSTVTYLPSKSFMTIPGFHTTSVSLSHTRVSLNKRKWSYYILIDKAYWKRSIPGLIQDIIKNWLFKSDVWLANITAFIFCQLFAKICICIILYFHKYTVLWVLREPMSKN